MSMAFRLNVVGKYMRLHQNVPLFIFMLSSHPRSFHRSHLPFNYFFYTRISPPFIHNPPVYTIIVYMPTLLYTHTYIYRAVLYYTYIYYKNAIEITLKEWRTLYCTHNTCDSYSVINVWDLLYCICASEIYHTLFTIIHLPPPSLRHIRTAHNTL